MTRNYSLSLSVQKHLLLAEYRTGFKHYVRPWGLVPLTAADLPKTLTLEFQFYKTQVFLCSETQGKMRTAKVKTAYFAYQNKA